MKELMECPPAFGTGVKRFYEPVKSEVVGPGSYNIPIGKKKQKMRKVWVASALASPVNNLNTANNLKHELERFHLDKPKNFISATSDIRAKAAARGSSAFCSNIKRFDSQGKEIGHLLGPGTYNVKGENFVNSTFNVEGSYFAREGIAPKKPMIKNMWHREVGPGEYDYDLDVVKPKASYSIKINPDINFKKAKAFLF